MNIYVIPAALALIVKLAVLFFAQRTSGASRVFMVMVLIFACHNICEVLLFWEFFDGVNANYLLRMYYVISVGSLLFISWYVASILSLRQSINIRISTSICLIFVFLIVFTNFIVAGSTPLTYIDTALRGEYYWTFQLLALTLLSSVIVQLYVSFSKADTHIQEIRIVYTAFALLPLFAAVILVIGIMHFGTNINGAMIFPVATTLFLVVTLASEYQHKLTDVRRFLPFSDERRTSSEIMEIFSSYARDDANYRDSISEIERLLVLHKLNKTDGNASLTAEKMGMPRSSLYSIFNRLKINVRN